ncbi:MAG: CHAD domain-containing protein, partial [Acidimicrobiia bacterium]
MKLTTWAGFVMPQFDGLVDGVVGVALATRLLDATYHDTTDLRLVRRGASLRYRTGDKVPWTVKLPDGKDGPLLVRKEISFDGPPEGVPEAATSLVRAYTRSAALKPVIRLRTRRAPVELTYGGAPVIEIVDDEVSVFEGRRLVSRFTEVEVEVTGEPPPGLLSAVVSCLRGAGATPGDGLSKVARALGPRALLAPEPVPVALGPESSAGDAVRAAIAAAVTRLLAHDPGVRLGDDPEDVHQARVATRRLRSDLRTFGTLVDRDWAGALRSEATGVAALLGAVRDPEVLMERLLRQAATLPESDRAGIEPLVARLAEQRNKARVALLDELDNPRYAGLLERLVDAAADPALDPVASQPGSRVLPGVVRRPWRRLNRAVQDLPQDPPDALLHEIRIHAKRCRYAAEAVVGVCGKRARA